MIKQEILTGYLIHTKQFGWQVKYYFGQNQSRNLFLHRDFWDYIKENGIEGEEVKFIIRGTLAKRTLNGSVSSAYLIIENEN